MAEKRVATGVAGLDQMLYGGFIPGSAILVRGAPGAGKTTLAFHYLIHGALCNEPGLMISFEEFPKSLYQDAESLGWDLRKLEEESRLHIMFTSPGVLLSSLEVADSPVSKMLRERRIQRVALDSLTHFTRTTGDTHALRYIYNTVINGLKREGVTTIFLGEEMSSDYTPGERGRLSFIVDCIVMLRYLEIESAIRRAILVLKMRSSPHDKAIHSYSIGKGGMRVGKVMKGHSGLLSGLTRRSIISTVE
jgi:circadian clock protein KaiC